MGCDTQMYLIKKKKAKQQIGQCTTNTFIKDKCIYSQCSAHLGLGGTTGHCPVENLPGASPPHHPHRFDHHETYASSHSPNV